MPFVNRQDENWESICGKEIDLKALQVHFILWNEEAEMFTLECVLQSARHREVEVCQWC